MRPDPEQKNVFLQALYVESSGGVGTGPREVPYFIRYNQGTTTANYWERAAAKDLPVNNHLVKIHKRTEKMLHRYQWVTYNTSIWNTYDDVYQYIIGSFPDYSYNIAHSRQAEEAAKSKLIKQVKNMSVNVAQVFAERQRTINMVGQTATKIARAIIAAKKGNMAQAARALTGARGNAKVGTSMAENWLALQYGWKPLLSDVYGSMKALADNPIPRKKFRGRSTASGSKRRIVTVNSGVRVTNQEVSFNSTTKVWAVYQINDSKLRSLSSAGITDPALLAWELLPWSFVIDWFLPIGDYLQSLGYDLGLTYIGGGTVRITKNDWTVSIDSYKALSGSTWTTIDAATYITQSNVLFDRVRQDAPFALSLPSFKNPFNFTHLANGLALLRTARS